MSITVTTGDIERLLRAGRPPKDVATELQEPLNDVLAVWHRIRREQPAQPALRPAPVPAPDTQPAAGAAKPAVPGHELVARGLTSGDKRIARHAAKVQAGLDRLRDLLDAHDSKAAARADVERLERQLAAAKAKLRGSTPRPRPRSANSGGQRTFENRLTCSKFGRKSPTAQGRAAHERHCKGGSA